MMPQGEDRDELASLLGRSGSCRSLPSSLFGESHSSCCPESCAEIYYRSWGRPRQLKGLTLTWKNLTVKAQARRDRSILQPWGHDEQTESRLILNGTTGSAYPGSLTAIMGTSGSGKSTLLNCLAYRNRTGLEISGDIRVNGRPHGRYIQELMAYVQQDDMFCPSLTVREHLLFHFGLESCKDTLIGKGEEEKSISGGERKRLAIATEILTDPPLLLFDEPTTGLDSFMAQTVVSMLSKMAQKGKTVICTIHQPSSEVFAIFDRLLLLAEGRTAYLGEAYEALDFFDSIGYTCPSTFNPADYYILALAVDPFHEARDKEIVSKICNRFAESPYASEMEALIDLHTRNQNDIELDEVFYDIKSKKVPWPVQFYMLLWKCMLDSIRNPAVMKVRIFQKLFLAIMIGLVYFRVVLNQEGIMAVNGAIFVFITENTFPSMYGVLQIPGFIFEPVFFMTICYWMIDLNDSVFRFIETVLVIVLTANTASACGCFFSAAFMNVSLAMMVLVPFDVVMMITGGIFVNVGTLPSYISWTQYLSWFRYSNEAIMITQWEDVENITCNTPPNLPCLRTGKEVLESFDFDASHLYWNVTFLGILYGVFHILGFIALWIRSRKK